MSVAGRILEEFADQPNPDAVRRAAGQALREHDLPTRRDENWHYANLRSLEQVPRFAPSADHQQPPLPALPAALPGYERLVFLDGRLQHGASAGALSKIDQWRSAPSEEADAFETSGDGRFGLLARMFAPSPLALRVRGPLALELISILSSQPGPAYNDLSVTLDPGARLHLVERCMAASPSSEGEVAKLGCSSARLRLGRGAQLVHTRLQQAGEQTLHYETLSVQLAEAAHYQLRQLTAGAATSRSSVQVRLLDRDATMDVHALAAARAAHYADSQITALHEAPGTHSHVLFRGIASERAHLACSADVQVTLAARGARVLQSLRGMIDGKGAEVNLRPRLTINTDDVQASHGATTGRLDDDLLFYLLSRGLAPEMARSLLKWAFLGETLSVVAPAELRHAAELAVAARLSDTPAAELLQ